MQKEEIISIIEDINYLAQKKGSGDFVGAVYDTASQDGELPVALIIGINYGQRGTSSLAVGRCAEKVNYAKHVTAYGKKHYHTVLWNFFPYLTDNEWLDDISNSADEAERIFDLGYDDPFSVFSDLVQRLDPEIIVFHGVSSAVPILARIAIRRVKRPAILAPNLARGFNPCRAKKIA